MKRFELRRMRTEKPGEKREGEIPSKNTAKKKHHQDYYWSPKSRTRDRKAALEVLICAAKL